MQAKDGRCVIMAYLIKYKDMTPKSKRHIICSSIVPITPVYRNIHTFASSCQHL